MLAAAYYLLPGPYEWEAGRKRELFAVFLLPPLGVAGFLLFTGRLAAITGGTMTGTLIAFFVLFLLSFPTWRSLPRMVVAAVPSAILITGLLDDFMLQYGLPVWLLATIFGLISMLVAARIYVFAVLPMLAICYLITRFF